ncbi:AraC family transcriptional regulator [Paenibacillus sp. H1-7]|uniref:helix-turn-helix transcriptional regulator n=1 Tax=Paenibacillus sp. H1-7 TaxID=2282849 RepID=UPI001EF8D47C|nr:AraC family transcriptional regulator [Paenibacillus sp. H1-7]ULL13873.1 AraC family transcriptional regulator [Paenibacillus sp. H1-7]
MNRLIANRGLLQIFFALLLVIAIMLASNYVVYKNSISGIYETVAQNNRLVIKNIIQSFDSSFKTVNNLVFAIHGLPYDSLASQEDGRLDMAKVYSMQDNLSTLISSVDFIENAVVFYNNADLAITAKGTSDMKHLFNTKYKHDRYNAEYWRSFTKSSHPFKLFPADEFTVLNENLSQASRRLMVAVDGNKVRLSDKNVMLLIDVDRLLQQIDLTTMIPGASLIVLDAERNVVLSTDTNWDLAEVLDDIYMNPSREASVTRKNFEYNVYKSDYNDFIYINKVPYQFRNVGWVTNANLWIMISSIVCAVLLSALLSTYLYRPVKDILKLLGGGTSKGNDFRKIYSGIVKVQQENEALQKQIEFVKAEMRRGVFLQTLDGYAHTPEFEYQIQQYYPYFFRERYFVMAAVQLRRLDDNDSAALSVEDLAESIRNGLRKTADHVVVFHTGGLQFLALVGIDESSDRKKVMDGLEAYLKRSEKEELYGFKLWACVSKRYESKIIHCSAAYQDIVDGIRYRQVGIPRFVIDTESVRYAWDIYFPFEKIEKLSNSLVSGKTEDGLRLVDEIMQENAGRHIHHHQLGHIAKSIFYHLLKQADGSAANGKELYRLETDFCRQVDHADDYKDVRDALQDVVRYIGGKRGQDSKSKLNAAFISQYIELHYMENLYLDHMAEVLDTSPKYFSNYFKKTFGIGYVEYLNKVRLSHAKEFLKQTDLSVAEIGEKTGYLNASTFTTTFKKYVGISPTEYRKKPVD